MYHFSGVIIITQDNKIALQCRDNKPNIANPGKVAIFAGGFEKNETAKQAAVRELKEELKLKVKESELTFFGQYRFDSAFLKKKVVANIFLLKNIEVKKLHLEEGKRIVYIKARASELKKINLSKFSRLVIQRYIKQAKNGKK